MRTSMKKRHGLKKKKILISTPKSGQLTLILETVK